MRAELYSRSPDEGKAAAAAQLASYRPRNCHKVATSEEYGTKGRLQVIDGVELFEC